MTYQQFGVVAIIYEDGHAIAVAKHVDGLWRANYQRQENETRTRSNPSLNREHVASDLDRLVFEMTVRANGAWITRDTLRKPYDAKEWSEASGDPMPLTIYGKPLSANCWMPLGR
jgi:hypothetical protein